MKRMMAALLAALMAMGTGAALAEKRVTVHVQAGCMDEAQHTLLTQLLWQAAEGVELEIIDGRTQPLRSSVLADRAPDLAICQVQEAALYAKEGMLLPLDRAVLGGEIAQTVAASCCIGDDVFMAPLRAQERKMAVSRRALGDLQLTHLLDTKNHPVWLPMQVNQVLDEASLHGKAGMEIWPLTGENCEGVFALVQAIYGGLMLSEDGTRVTAGSDAAAAGAAWLQTMVECGQIGKAESREEALRHFLSGESVLFADWTQEESGKYAGRMQDILLMPYPSSSGISVHAFDLIGVVAFAGDDEEKNALCRQAAMFLGRNEQAIRAFSPRGIEADDAQWIVPPGVIAHTGALRGALCTAFNNMMDGAVSADAALRSIKAATTP